MVVTPSGRYITLSYESEHKLRVYHIETDGSSTLLHTFGGEGSGPKRFNKPFKMCLASNGNLLVCDCNNDRVQELGRPGEKEPVHVRDIHVRAASTIARHGDMIAVGTCNHKRASDTQPVVLLSYATGAVIRSFCMLEGCSAFSMGSTEGLRFTSDGRFILVHEGARKYVSKFRVSDGALEDLICEGQVSDAFGSHSDIRIARSGDVIVADCAAHRICVFSADGRTLLRTWGTRGFEDGQPRRCYPTALALVDDKLFVLDCWGVQVFE